MLKVQKDGNIDKENRGAVAPSFGASENKQEPGGGKEKTERKQENETAVATHFGGDENKQKGSGKKKGREKNKEDNIENIMSKMLEEDFRGMG